MAAKSKDSVGLYRYLDNWFFAKGSPVTLGLFRVVICAIAFINLAMIAIDFDAWYSESGYVPLDTSRQYAPDFSPRVGNYELAFPIPRINFLIGANNDTFIAVFYAVVMVAALLSMVGLWTRFSTIVLALGMLSLQHRNLLILHGGDTALRQFLLILAIAPSGAACSLDRFIAVWQGRAPPEPEPISLWGQRLIQFQIAILYFTAVWWKWQGSHWRDGTATYYIHQLTEFNRFPVPQFMDRQPFVALETYGTLLTELALATLVFYRPFRKWVLLSGLAMHGYIEYRFNIPMFAFVTTSAYLCFYDGEEVKSWALRLGRRFKRVKLRVLLPVGERLAPAKGAAIKNLDPLGLVSYEKGAGKDWEAMSASGQPKEPIAATWQRSLGAWPLALAWRTLLRRATEQDESHAETKTIKRPTVASAKGGSA
ncbi:MAG: HTTM domain-containing protein [Fimbriimonadaceae bacterium]